MKQFNTIGSRLSLLIGATGALLLLSWGATAYGERRVSTTVRQIQDELRRETVLESQGHALDNLDRPGNDILESWDVDAQEARLPQPSPAAKAALTVGVTDIEIVYHRPGVKGRQIWGGLVPFGEVWRLGANEATTISFSTAVQVEGRDVPAGTYGLFAIPGPETWTLILNKQPKQWGAYFYKKEEDLVRFEVKPQPGPATEWMAFHLTPISGDAATVEMAWEKLRVPFTVRADTERMVWESLDKALAGKPDAETYLTAVQHALNTGARLDDAMAWTDKALALQENFWGHEFKAKLLQRQGKVEEALQHLDKAMALAKGKAPQAYIDGLAKLKGEWKG